MTENIPLSQRRFDYFFIGIFTFFFFTSLIADMVPTVLGALDPNSSNILVKINVMYAQGCDPLFMNPPVWMRFATGVSSFVYAPFYLILVYAFIKGINKIHVPALLYAASIISVTGIIIFGVEFFGESQWRCQNIPKFLAFNSAYVLVPMLLIARMRRPLPFTRKF